MRTSSPNVNSMMEMKELPIIARAGLRVRINVLDEKMNLVKHVTARVIFQETNRINEEKNHS